MTGRASSRWATAALAAAALVAAGCGTKSSSSSSPSAIAKDVQQSVVGLSGRVGDDDFAGSAFVYDAGHGLVITNAHVTWGASELRATMADGTQARGSIAAEAPCDDIAAIALEPAPVELRNAKLGDAASVKPGDTATAVGYTPGVAGRKLVVTQGAVAAANFPSQIDHRLPRLPSLIEHQAPLTPSESGGPLLDADRRVVGMNSVVGEAHEAHAEPPFYAVTINRIKQRLGELRRSPSGRYVGWHDAHRCHRPLERLARTLHHGYKSAEEMGGAMHGENHGGAMREQRGGEHHGAHG